MTVDPLVLESGLPQIVIVRATALAALCLSLAWCAPPAPPPPPTPPALVDIPEGTYTGSSTRFQADRKNCPRPGLVTVVVWDGKFQYKWDREVYVDAILDADGSIHGDGPGISLQGKRTGKRIEGDITNGECGLHFTLLRKD